MDDDFGIRCALFPVQSGDTLVSEVGAGTLKSNSGINHPRISIADFVSSSNGEESVTGFRRSRDFGGGVPPQGPSVGLVHFMGGGLFGCQGASREEGFYETHREAVARKAILFHAWS